MRLAGRRHRLPFGVMLGLAVVVLFILFEVVYRLLMPFVAGNPLYHEVTIGEPVIDSWQYGGETTEGYLKFYDTSTYETVTLPPNAQLFGADGKFVVIKHATPGSLTFAPPLESAPPIWYVLMLMLVVGSLWFMMRRLKVQRKRRMHLRRPQQLQNSLSQIRTPLQGRRFRATKKQRPRLFR